MTEPANPFPPFDEADGIPWDWSPDLVRKYLEWRKQHPKPKEPSK